MRYRTSDGTLIFPRKCPVCSTTFEARSASAKYCSHACTMKSFRDRKAETASVK